MANRTGPALVPHDQGDKPIHNLGRGSVGSDAARRDDILAPADLIPEFNGGAGYSGVGLPNGEYPASIRHSHPERDPEVEGATLFPAKIADPLMRDPVRCILAHGEAFGFGDGFTWEQVAGQSTWQKISSGQIYGMDSSGNPTIALVNGDRIGVWQSGTGDEDQYYGPYIVVDCGLQPNGLGGYTSTRAVIRRTDDANTPAGLCNGMIFQVTGVGAEYTGTYFTLTTADPITVDTTPLTFTTSSSVTSEISYELLTSAQLATRHATSTAITESATLTSGSASLAPITVTLSGTPGVSALAAGVYKITALLRVSADNPAANTVFTMQLAVKHPNGSVETPFAVLTSPPIRSDRDYAYTFQVTIAAAVACSPEDVIQATPGVTSDSATPITLYFTYQDPARTTRITLPFAVAAGVPTVPAGAITPGRIHTPFGTATIVDTRLTMPDRNDCLVTADASGLLTAIATDGWVGGDKIWLTIVDPINVIHNATSYPTNFAPLFLSSVAGVPGDIKTKPVSPTAGDLFNNRFQFQLRTDAGITPSPCWQLIAPHVAGKKA